MTLQNGVHLRAARLRCTAALDKWLLENIATSSLVLPDQPARFEEALFIVHMTVLQGGNDVRTEPFICLGSFVGSKDDGDVPPWTSILKPGQTHYFLETTAFAATVTDIKVESVSSQNISSRMCLWACSVSAGTQVEADVAAHCDQLKRKESERQGDGMYNLATRGSSMHNLKMIPMMVPLTTPVPPPIFMALLTDSSSVNLPPDTIENFSPDVSDMNRPIANSKDVIALEVQAVESVDGTMNASRHPRLVRRVAPTPGTTRTHWEVTTNIPQMRSSKLV
ncbi:hypothetical protein DFH08DRAFT_971257 [Mycena albidolilacea]|uniref:Uncharacterized protein n=1 Tax=Mycena albidolilacea TaxID=1033008 RepID=A0AAD7EFY6_9AGAR|nr:hypothetical protein DFH08DRAFT_971257 [Mycena albidolilacea]